MMKTLLIYVIKHGGIKVVQNCKLLSYRLMFMVLEETLNTAKEKDLYQ